MPAFLLKLQMQIDFVEPWVAVGSEQEALENELRRELSPDNVLSGFSFRVIGRRVDCDDVLVEVCEKEANFKLALVHLTWRGKSEPSPWPITDVFASAKEFVANAMEPDAKNYN